MVNGGIHKPEYYEDELILPIGIITQILTVFVKATRNFNKVNKNFQFTDLNISENQEDVDKIFLSRNFSCDL